MLDPSDRAGTTYWTPFRRANALAALVAATGGVGCVDSPPDAPAAARVADRSRVQVEALWPSGAPGALGDSAEDQPSLVVYLPELADATGTGVIVVPGGGYDHLAMDHEGHQVARWLV